MMEIKMGKVAKKQATTSRIKNFANMIIHDHKSVQSALTNLALKERVVLTTSLDKKHQSKISDIKDKSGKSFDKSYIKTMIKGHKDAITKFNEATKNVQDTSVIHFIRNTLPGLHKHLDSAQAIQRSMKNS